MSLLTGASGCPSLTNKYSSLEIGRERDLFMIKNCLPCSPLPSGRAINTSPW
uniref:Uncharacterized protein n=1 Tax=Picea glauca TaxID=3330 RepID=A0A101M136_PICGL|nr:hypothetical protein ABT39_MTgene3645 [Picea glauca]